MSRMRRPSKRPNLVKRWSASQLWATKKKMPATPKAVPRDKEERERNLCQAARSAYTCPRRALEIPFSPQLLFLAIHSMSGRSNFAMGVPFGFFKGWQCRDLGPASDILLQDAVVFTGIRQEGLGRPDGIVLLQIMFIETISVEITGDDLILQPLLDLVPIGIQGLQFPAVHRQ